MNNARNDTHWKLAVLELDNWECQVCGSPKHLDAAHILPQIPYDRPALRSREARHKLSQEIMRAFEAPIRQHLDQWYHFVPIWP